MYNCDYTAVVCIIYAYTCTDNNYLQYFATSLEQKMKEGEKVWSYCDEYTDLWCYHIAFSQSCHHADFMLAK